MNYEFLGYENADGSVGVRNKVLILPTVVCVNDVVNKIGLLVSNASIALHTCGCTQLGYDYELTYRTLLGTALNPNVFSILVVGLGCEKVEAHKLGDDIAKSGKPVEVIEVQELGYERALEKGVNVLHKFIDDVGKLRRKSFDVSNLVVGLECGGSDATSSIATNPTVGYVSDKLVDLGATVIFAETPEVIGAEHLLINRIKERYLKEKLLKFVEWFENEVLESGLDIRGTNPTPGNIAGGLTTIEEKSLGAIIKSGSRPINDVVDYAEKPKRKGVVFMNTPGYDIESVTGLVAGGSQLIIFTTGRGTPAGSPISPVIKVSGNPKTCRKLESIIDVCVGGIIDGIDTLDGAGERLFQKLLDVASGALTASEILKHNEYSIWRVKTSF
ncbi:MAG: UxaA family hydrolase [Sulfolobales archaeon]